jgi:hypothetical protein
VTTPKEYRENADECLAWAKTAKSEREREIFLEMAQAWLQAAHQAETRKSHTTPDAPGQQASRDCEPKPR